MAKKQSAKLWELAHKDKVSEYGKKYRQKKAQATVVLEDWVREKIDKVKVPNQTYGNWLRLLVEDWAKTSE
ncbi:hypothetical protein [Scytonema sp. NUACC26]|uniref:hypothetical protein n=1 Tax=Scytonema sp. NUACC26 TaxID=3140176 RepID=UPI0034DBD066